VWWGIGRLSMVYGSRMLQSLILIDALSSACREKKREREIAGRLFSQCWRPDTHCWLCCVGFLQLLGAIKGWFKGQSLNFICT
jgi:hypothetical protein